MNYKYGVTYLVLFALLVVSVQAQTVDFLKGSVGDCGSSSPCYAAYNITAGRNGLVLDENSFWFEFRDEANMGLRHARQVKPLDSWDVTFATPKYTDYPFWVSDMDCVNTWFDEEGIEQCTDNGEYVTRNRLGFNLLREQTQTLRAGESTIVYVSAMKKRMKRVDNVLVLKQDSGDYRKYEEWYWWGPFEFFNSTTPSRANLTAYWSMDNATTSRIWDDTNSSIWDMDTIVSDPGIGNVKIGRGTIYDGNDDFNTGSDLVTAFANRSFSGWWRPNSTAGTQALFTLGDDAQGDVRYDGTQLRCRARIGGTSRQANIVMTPVIGARYFVACNFFESPTQDNVTIYLWNETAFMGTANVGGNFGTYATVAHNQRFCQRSNGGGNFCTGSLDEWGLWTQRGSEGMLKSEFEALYNATSGCNPVKYPTCNLTVSGASVNTSQFFTAETIETNVTTFKLLLDQTGENATVATANLTYNGTIFAGVMSSNVSGATSTNFTFEVNVTTPSPGDAEENLTWNWTYFTNNAASTTFFDNTSNEQQTIYQVYVDDCTEGWTVDDTRTYAIRDIDTFSLISADTVSSWKVTWNSKSRVHTPSWLADSTPSLCIFPDFATYNASVNLTVNASNYATGVFSFTGLTLTPTNVNSILFLQALGGIDLVTVVVKDENDAAVENVLVSIERFNPVNNFTLVTSGFTDFQGQRQFSLNTSFEHRINLTQNGQLLTLINGNPASVGPFQILDTTLTFRVLLGQGSSLQPLVQILNNIDYNLTFYNASNFFQLNFTDVQDVASQVCLRVTHVNATHNTQLGSNCSTANFDVLNFSVGNQTGQFIGEGWARSNQDNRWYKFASMTVLRQLTEALTDEGTILTIIIVLTMAGVGLVVTGGNPVGVMVGATIGVAASALLSLINVTWFVFAGLVIVAGIYIHNLRT